MLDSLKGKKTYITTVFWLLYQGYQWYTAGAVPDWNAVFAALALMFTRSAIANSGGAPADVPVVPAPPAPTQPSVGKAPNVL